MCGIAGIIGQTPVEAELLAKMSRSIRHRGPDDEGFALATDECRWAPFSGDDTVPELQLPKLEQNKSFRIGLVHRRLSILDLSPLGHQPMLSDDGQRALVFNGEIYNYQELRTELQAAGRTFRSPGDTEVVLAALEHWGTEAFKRFRGMWALAWVNLTKREMILSRDRFGIKPLYWCRHGGKFSFASEIKALLAAGVLPPKVQRERLFEYLAFGTLAQPYAEPYTHLESVSPGTFLTVNTDTLVSSETRYYDLEAAVQETKKQRPGWADFAPAFEESVRLHLRSDVPVGACLSGGLDSSAIVAACAGQMEGAEFHTYTAAFPGQSVDESHFAKQVADCYLNVQPHFTTPRAEDLVASLNDLIYTQDLPVGSTSVFAQWAVMQRAHADGITVLLDGQGADETLGGYYPFAGLRLIGLLRRGRLGGIVANYRHIRERFTPNVTTALARAGYYYLPESAQRMLRRRQRLGTRFIADDYARHWQMPIPDRGGRDFESHGLRSLQFGLYELLRYEDRNSMAFGIESRVPFLDHPLVELILALPEADKLHEGWTKYPVRRYLQGKVPDAITWRVDKLGFVTPQQDWKAQLAPALRTYLDQYDYPPELHADYFRSLARTDLSHATHLSEFWRAYSVLRWLEVFGVEMG